MKNMNFDLLKLDLPLSLSLISPIVDRLGTFTLYFATILV